MTGQEGRKAARKRRVRVSAEGLIERVRRKCNCCWVDICADQGCAAQLPDVPFACLSGTRHQKNHNYRPKLCDFVVFWVTGKVERAIAVEMKTGRFDLAHAVEQLQNGAQLAEGILGTAHTVTFAPCLFRRDRIRTMEIRQLRKYSVTFRGARYNVRLRTCGEPLPT